MNEELKKLEELLANDRKIIEDNYKEIERLKGALQTHEILLRSNTKEIERLNNIIQHTDSWIDRTIEIIKQQPSEDDTWILERLNGIKQCLKEVIKSETN